MPNQRSKGQKLLNFQASKKFIDICDKAAKLGRQTRSEFIRQAIFEALRRRGMKISQSLTAAPSRVGKGGARVLRSLSRPDSAPDSAEAAPVRLASGQRGRARPEAAVNSGEVSLERAVLRKAVKGVEGGPVS